MAGKMTRAMERALELYRQGLSPWSAAEQAGVRISGIYAAIARLREAGDDTLPPKRPPGRPKRQPR